MAAETVMSDEYLHADIGYRLVGVSSAFIALTTLFVALRFYARSLTRATYGLDDWLVLVSYFLQIGLSAVAIGFVKYGGVGRHLGAIRQQDPQMAIDYYKWLLVVSFCYFFVVPWPKLAILALFQRIFTTKQYRYIIWTLAGIVTCTSLVMTPMTLNLCHPFRFNWDHTIKGGWCLHQQLFYRWGSLPNIITDIVMLILPAPVVWKLHTSGRVKIGLTVAFMTGSLGLVTSILRFASFFRSSATEDGTWTSVDLMTWTIVEPGVYLIAACLPTYRPLISKVVEKTRAGYGTDGLAGGMSDRYKLSQQQQQRHWSSASKGFHKVGSSRDTVDTEAIADIPMDNFQPRPHVAAGQITVKRDFDVDVEQRSNKDSR